MQNGDEENPEKSETGRFRKGLAKVSPANLLNRKSSSPQLTRPRISSDKPPSAPPQPLMTASASCSSAVMKSNQETAAPIRELKPPSVASNRPTSSTLNPRRQTILSRSQTPPSTEAGASITPPNTPPATSPIMDKLENQTASPSTPTKSKLKVAQRNLARPARPPPSAPPQATQQSPFSQDQLNTFSKLAKRLLAANKQLLAVSRTAAEKIKKLPNSPKVEFISSQLNIARDELQEAVTQMNELLMDTSKLADVNHLNKVLNATLPLSQNTSSICTGLKSVAVVAGDPPFMKPVLTSITTGRDSINEFIEFLNDFSEKFDISLFEKLALDAKNCDQLLESIIGLTSGKLITLGKRLEVEASARVVIISIVKLINLFSYPIEQTIINQARVCSCTISQLCSNLNEISSDPTVKSNKEIKIQILEFVSELKRLYWEFIEKTKTEVGDYQLENLQSFENMKNYFVGLKEYVVTVVSHILAFEELETSNKESWVTTPKDKHIQRANLITTVDEVVSQSTNAVKNPPLDLPGKNFLFFLFFFEFVN